MRAAGMMSEHQLQFTQQQTMKGRVQKCLQAVIAMAEMK
jgi:hypothetical protein